MKINRRGVTRIVIELEKVVVKLPNFTCQWDHFLLGLINNMAESKLWKAAIEGHLDNELVRDVKSILCPVVWSSWGGWMLIMRKADVESHIKEMNEGKKWLYVAHINAGFNTDNKPENFGYLNGKLVKVDYA